MPMVQVDCVIHGDIEEAGTRCSFHASKPLRFQQLQSLFPFEGKFHFRIKITGRTIGIPDTDFVWLDVSPDDEVLQIPSESESVEIQALAIELPLEESSDSEFSPYFEDINQEVGLNPFERPNRFPVELQKNISKNRGGLFQKIKKGVSTSTKVAAQNIHIQKIAQGASSLWNSVQATASNIQQSLSQKASHLSAASHQHLTSLTDDLTAKYTEAKNSSLLEELWKVQFPGRPFERNSAIWKEAGWQQPDPITDLKLSGLLALKSLTYLGIKFSSKTQEMLTRNKANVKANYPFAIVGVNLTLLLADLIGLRDQKYLSGPAGFEDMFEDSTAFYELFCIAFLHVDNIWTHRKAVRTDFGKIIGETKALVSQVLQLSPKSIQEFKYMAADEGMVVADLS